MKKLTAVFGVLAFGVVMPALGEDLAHLMQNSLTQSPQILKARAETLAAQDRMESAKSLHYPTLKVGANTVGAEWHRDKADNAEHKFSPYVEASVNLYSFGAIESQVDSMRAERDYYQQKTQEIEQNLAYHIGESYLSALNAKEHIAVLKNSLSRHQSFLAEIGAIVKHDNGRRSEYIQAQARKLLVEQKINEEQRLLQTQLNRLHTLTQKNLTSKALKAPFANLNSAELVRRFGAQEISQHPAYLTAQAQVKSKEVDYQMAKHRNLPSIDLTGRAGRDDRSVMLNVSWGVYDRGNEYYRQEKAHLQKSASADLNALVLNLQEMSAQAKIDMQLAQKALQNLHQQITANRKVADFYRLQFKVGRKSLFEVLSAENDLTEVHSAYVNAQYQWNRAVLDYLQAQGQLLRWANLNK